LCNENEWREVCAIKLGYARVSTNEQDTSAQVSALKSVGCEKIFREKASGGRWDRPELLRLLDQMLKDDILIVSRLVGTRSFVLIRDRQPEGEKEMTSSSEESFCMAVKITSFCR
jgi:predicted site-specific integrase-resolvase